MINMIYLARRAVESRAAAEMALHPASRKAHLTLAKLYRQRCWQAARDDFPDDAAVDLAAL